MTDRAGRNGPICSRSRPEPDPTGIDYLGLVAAAHYEAAGTGAKIDFARLATLAAASDQDRR